MTGFLGDPTNVLMRPEKPDFFLKTPGPLRSLDSSEYRFGGTTGFSLTRAPWDFSDMLASKAEKLADCRKGGGLITRGSGVEFDSGGGGGRVWEENWYVGDLAVSK